MHRPARRTTAVLAATIILATAPAAHAGMPSPLTLTDLARLRVEAISFFAVVFFASALVIKWLWNALRRDFPRLPHLTYARSLAVVALWGLLFVLVLTMISGARELMTPGAWERNGATYRLASTRPGDFASQRWGRMAELKAALWSYAAAHAGQLPASPDVPEIPPHLWQTPDLSAVRYVYVPGHKINDGSNVIAFEPPAFPEPRLALRASGNIEALSNNELRTAAGGKSP